MQLRRYRPRVLNEPLVHLACPTCVRPRADLGVAVGQTESKIGDSGSGGTVQTAAVVGKHEGPVLVVRAARDSRYVDLVVIVFTLIVEIDTRLDRMISENLRHAIRNGVDRALRVRRIRTAGKAVKVRNADRRDLFWCRFGSGNNVGEVDSQRASVEARKRRVYRDIYTVDTDRAAQLVDKGRRDCPRPCEDVRLIGTIEVLACQA